MPCDILHHHVSRVHNMLQSLGMSEGKQVSFSVLNAAF